VQDRVQYWRAVVYSTVWYDTQDVSLVYDTYIVCGTFDLDGKV